MIEVLKLLLLMPVCEHKQKCAVGSWWPCKWWGNREHWPLRRWKLQSQVLYGKPSSITSAADWKCFRHVCVLSTGWFQGSFLLITQANPTSLPPCIPQRLTKARTRLCAVESAVCSASFPVSCPVRASGSFSPAAEPLHAFSSRVLTDRSEQPLLWRTIVYLATCHSLSVWCVYDDSTHPCSHCSHHCP